MNKINEAINSNCNKLVELTFNDNLHDDFHVKTTIGKSIIYCSRFIGDKCIQPIDTFFVPKKEREIEHFNAKVDVFIAGVIDTFSK